MEVTSPTSGQTLDIYPLSKGKRILLFLADYFLHFIFAIFLFTVAGFPLSSWAVNSNQLEAETNANTASQIQLLYQSDLLFSESPAQTDFTADITYTQKKFVCACLSDPSVDNPFYTFYSGTLQKSIADLNSLYQTQDKKPFFSSDVDAKGFLRLLPLYQTEFSPLLDQKNSLTSVAETDYGTFSTGFFLPLYHAMIAEIEKGDSLPQTSPLLAYRGLSLANQQIQNKLDNTLIITTYSVYLFSGAILFLLIPLVNSKGQSLGMILLREVRLGDDNLALLPRRERSFLAVYQFILDLSFVPFLPLAYVSKITNLFNLPGLDIIALVSLAFAGASLIVLLFSKFNKDLSDVASRSVVVDDVSHLEIEKVRAHGK